MGAYRLLLGVCVEHEFYSDGLVPGLRLEPCAETAALLRRPGLAFRSSADGVDVVFDEGRVDALTLLAADGGGKLTFRFRARAEGQSLAQSSEDFVLSDPSRLVHLDSERAARDPSGARRLHRGAFVAEEDLVDLDDPALEALLEPRDRRVRPLFTMRIAYGPTGRQKLATRLARAPDRYVVRFAARSTYWKYYVLGSLKARELDIVDLDARTRFEPMGLAALADERPALAFRSTEAIALRQRSERRFQLRERRNGNGRVLVKRLPVADAGLVASERVDGQAVPVSEIYVNG